MNKRILVIGDTILDEYIYVKSKKLSEEAPVITSNITSVKHSLGGGANVARNIVSLGEQCTYIGLTSKEFDESIKSAFNSAGVKFNLFKSKNAVQKKTRVISMGNQIARYDSIISHENYSSIHKEIIEYLNKEITKFDAVIISKYYDEFLTESFLKKIIAICNKNKKIIISDNRQKNHLAFKNVDYYKANFNEFCAMFDCEKIDNTIEDISAIVKTANINFKNLLLTRSDKPTLLISNGTKKSIQEIPIMKVDVSDVSGAGDTFVASFIIAKVNGYNDLDAINFAHQVCHIVVQKLGTEVVWTYEIDTLNDDLKTMCKQLKGNNRKIVFTNGVFDILHEGHVRLLEYAKQQGDYLIVGINSDSSVKKIKGDLRPIKTEQERKLILESLRFVDKVIIFSDKTVDRLLSEIQPNVYVKGGDYNVKTLPEKKSLKYVDKLLFFKTIPGKSSTNLINKMKTK